jgi:protein-L-isoaspartate(D-aspartate) O-methyltransferase
MSLKHLIVWIFAQLVFLSGGMVVAEEYTLQRQQMVTEIEDDVQVTAKYIDKKSFNKLVLQAMNTVPRHEFVPANMRSVAYAQLVAQVYSIEIIEELGKSSTQLLTRLGYDNVETRIADGYDGWPQHAPFDSIIVTAAISHIP